MSKIIKPKKIGITGGIAMGKSFILAHISSKDINVISCDSISIDVYATPLVQDYLSNYAHKYHPETSEINRKIVRDWMLLDNRFKQGLESIMHPEIRKRMMESSCDIVEVPLLFENNLEKYFEHIWVVSCSPETQLKRLVNRIHDEKIARELIKSQLPIEEKIKKATRNINTECDVEEVYQQIDIGLREDL